MRKEIKPTYHCYIVRNNEKFYFNNDDFTIDFYVQFSLFSLAGNQFLKNRFLMRK